MSRRLWRFELDRYERGSRLDIRLTERLRFFAETERYVNEGAIGWQVRYRFGQRSLRTLDLSRHVTGAERRAAIDDLTRRRRWREAG